MKVEATCQLLTAINDGEKAAERLLDPNYAVQQKFDGKRIILQIERASITAHNREGLVCPISKHVLDEAKRFAAIAPLTLDGEWLREPRLSRCSIFSR
jgi:ATP-dependent DNA ligase